MNGDVHLNGRLTLGENTADNGGARVAYRALQKTLEGKPRTTIDGFTPEQRFFLGFANVWCQNVTEHAARQLAQTDPHSPGEFRVIGDHHEHGGVPEGLLLQGGPADGAGERLPGVVRPSEAGLAVRSRWRSNDAERAGRPEGWRAARSTCPR